MGYLVRARRHLSRFRAYGEMFVSEVRPGDAVVVVFRGPAGTPVGLGVQVGDRDVLTCAHVVNAALGLPPDAAARPAHRVLVSWPKLSGSPSVEAEIEGWRPIAIGDLATVRLLTAAPLGSAAARLAEQPSGQGKTLRVFGYPEGRPKGQWAEVRSVGTVEGGWLQLNSADGSTPDVRAGFSGSPLLDPRSGTVVGLVAEAPRRGPARDCLAVPATSLLAFRADLAAERPGPAFGAGPRDRLRRAEAPPAELTVLHLSDTQFGANHMFGGNGLAAADRDGDSLFERLHEASC
jgi:hypothetical protein